MWAVEFRAASRSIQRNHTSIDILREITLRIAPGEFFQLVGPSGAGKSTLLRLVNRLADPTRGQVCVGGRDTTEWNPRELRRQVGMVQQVPTLIERSVADNLRLAAELAGQGQDLQQRIPQTLQLVQLSDDFLPRTEHELSVGQQQRVTIARALIGRPRVLLLDEPTSALDPTMSASLLQTIRRIHKLTGLTVLMVSHRWEELRQANSRVGVLIEGRLCEVGPAQQVLTNPQHPAVGKLIGSTDHEPHPAND